MLVNILNIYRKLNKNGFLCGSDSKESTCNVGGLGFSPWAGKNPLEKEMETHSSIFAWRIPWTERSLAGYSPWSRKESDKTEELTQHFE